MVIAEAEQLETGGVTKVSHHRTPPPPRKVLFLVNFFLFASKTRQRPLSSDWMLTLCPAWAYPVRAQTASLLPPSSSSSSCFLLPNHIFLLFLILMLCLFFILVIRFFFMYSSLCVCFSLPLLLHILCLLLFGPRWLSRPRCDNEVSY